MDVEVGAAGVTVQTWHVPAQKLRVTLLPPPPGRGAGGQVLALLETVRVADVVLMVTRAGHPDLLDQACKDALHALRVQGMPSVLGVVQGLSLGPLTGRAALKKFFVGELKQELGHYFTWYNQERPHQGLDDATPDELYFAQPLNKAA